MTLRSIIALSLCAALLLAGCGDRNRTLRFATGGPATVSLSVGQSLANTWNSKGSVPVTVLSGSRYTMLTNVEELAAGHADLALAQNDLETTKLLSDSARTGALRTVLPLYPEVFFIIYRDSLHPASLRDLIRGRRVALGERSTGTGDFARLLFTRFGIDSTEYTPVYIELQHRKLADSIDVCCYLTGLDNPVVAEALSGGQTRIFSLDDPSLANNGSAADGFCLNYQGARPYVIPRNAFGAMPDRPVLTVAVDAVLLARADVDRVAIYDLMHTLFSNRHALADQQPLLQRTTDQFDRKPLHFPLHEGAEMYLNRQEPSFIEKYADLVGVLFSLAAGIAGALSAFIQWNKRRRKDRINGYYMDVVAIDTQAMTLATGAQCTEALAKLNDLKGRAFLHLAQDKLSPDESFHILIAFIDHTIRVVEQRRTELAGA